MTRIVVFGDVHGNAGALRAALARARSQPFDRMVFVGDLLTFGHDVTEVLDLVAGAQHDHAATLLVGNHDRVYFSLQEGQVDALQAMPEWIRPSVELTLQQLGDVRYRDLLRWEEEVVIDDMLISHANPFGVGDTRYLTNPQDAEDATLALAARDLQVGIFGHTHRPRWCGVLKENEPPLDALLEVVPEAPILINAGSVGQPRDARGRSMILRVTRATNLTARFEALDYDVADHVARVRSSGLPLATIERLVSFFGASGAEVIR